MELSSLTEPKLQHADLPHSQSLLDNGGRLNLMLHGTIQLQCRVLHCRRFPQNVSGIIFLGQRKVCIKILFSNHANVCDFSSFPDHFLIKNECFDFSDGTKLHFTMICATLNRHFFYFIIIFRVFAVGSKRGASTHR